MSMCLDTPGQEKVQQGHIFILPGKKWFPGGDLFFLQRCLNQAAQAQASACAER